MSGHQLSSRQIIGYFAHGSKRSGELSHYGEQMRVMLSAMAETGGRYDKAAYQKRFRQDGSITP